MKKAITLAVIFLCCFSGIFLQLKGLAPSRMHGETSRLKMVISHNFGFNEEIAAKRVAYCAQKMGVDCLIVAEHKYSFTKRLFPRYSQFLLSRFQPNIVLSLHGGEISYQSGKNYLAMTNPEEFYFQSSPKIPHEDLTKFDAFLTSFSNDTKLAHFLQNYRISSLNMKWYPTCPLIPYRKGSHTKLFYCGKTWINTSLRDKYVKLFSLLDNHGYLRICGRKGKWNHTPNGYRGLEKRDALSIMDTMHKYGVTLILHTPQQHKSSTPLPRVFEAAAAASVIISDRHPFVEEHFKDVALFIDSSKNAVEMERDIHKHMVWLNKHPEKAQALAKRTYEIFKEKFTLESQLERFLKFHNDSSLEK